jgi:hypothetical protein
MSVTISFSDLYIHDHFPGEEPDAITVWAWYHHGLSSMTLARDLRNLGVPIPHGLTIKPYYGDFHRPCDRGDWECCQVLVDAVRTVYNVDPLDLLPAGHWARRGVR